MAEFKDADVTSITSEPAPTPPPRRPEKKSSRRMGLISTLLVIILIAWAIWSWGFCRFYVAPGKMAIITSKAGATMPPGQILAKLGQKGPLEEVLGEGRHIWNPLFYDWEIVDATFIPPGKVGVVTSLGGDPLPPGKFLAEPGQKGIWRKVLGPGMYRLNPKGYDVQIINAFSVPVGFAGVVTTQSGSEDGADNTVEQKGIRPDVLQPGIYYINPRQYSVMAIEVGVNQVSLMGEAGSVILTKNVAMDENNQMIQRLNQNVLEEQKRLREDFRRQAMQDSVQSAAEMLVNDPGQPARRAMSKIMPAPQAPGVAQGRRVEIEKDVPAGYLSNQIINFPSRDAFDISLEMTVEFEMMPKRLAAILEGYGSLPEAVDKKLMPEILSVSRNRGAVYRAVDFIAGSGREKFQNDLTETLRSTLEQSNIVIHSALISNVIVPTQILEPLRVTSLSKETELTNREKQNTAKKQAELNREMSLIRQSGEQVVQETAKMKAQIQAEMEREVATISADTLRQMASIDRETAEVRAGRTVALGRADAEALKMVEEEKAKGFGMKITAFGQDGGDYALYEFATQLNPNMTINLIHAGEGTLWTDLKNASLSELGGAASVKKK